MIRLMPKKTLTLLLIASAVISYSPTLALATGYTGVSLFFPFYFIASTIYLALVWFFLKKVKISLPLPVLVIMVIIKTAIVQAVLLYLFTPIFDFTVLLISTEKFCSQSTIDFILKYSKTDRVTEACNLLEQTLFGR